MTKRPAVGTPTYTAQGGGLFALATLAAIFWSEWRVHATPAELGAVSALVMWAGSLVGKLYRDRRAARLAAVALVLLAGATGCFSYQAVDPKTNQVLIEGKGWGRGCIAYTHNGTTTDVIVQSAGRSNWGSIGGILGIAELAASVFGGSGSPEVEDLGDAGCGGLFESAGDAPDEPITVRGFRVDDGAAIP